MTKNTKNTSKTTHIYLLVGIALAITIISIPAYYLMDASKQPDVIEKTQHLMKVFNKSIEQNNINICYEELEHQEDINSCIYNFYTYKAIIENNPAYCDKLEEAKNSCLIIYAQKTNQNPCKYINDTKLCNR